jgi:hypothetical protein
MYSMMMIKDILIFALKWVALIAFLPFLLPAFLIIKLMGMDLLNLDGMGIEIFTMFGIAALFAVGTGFFLLGKFI